MIDMLSDKFEHVIKWFDINMTLREMFLPLYGQLICVVFESIVCCRFGCTSCVMACLTRQVSNEI